MSPVVIPGGCLYEGARNWRVFLVSSIVALIDYGSGNLRSAEKALARAARESATGHEIVVTDKPGVVAGDHCVEAERQGAVEHRGELDPLVAAHARIRCTAGGVLLDEVVHHVRGEPLSQVPDVKRDPDRVGRSPRVAGVLERAATARAATVRLRALR